MVFEEDQGLKEYVGGYSDWQKQLLKEAKGKRELVNNASQKPLQKLNLRRIPIGWDLTNAGSLKRCQSVSKPWKANYKC